MIAPRLYYFLCIRDSFSIQFPFISTEIIRQINQQMEKRQSWKIQSYQEYEEQQKREEARQENVRKVIAAKVTEMRESKIPEHIIRDVERQLKLDHN